MKKRHKYKYINRLSNTSRTTLDRKIGLSNLKMFVWLEDGGFKEIEHLKVKVFVDE